MISECILQGEKVRLRPVEERDLPHFVQWLNDPEVRRWLSLSDGPLLTMESEREWYQASRNDPQTLVWAIETREGQLIGSIDLRRIEEEQGRAELGIAIQDKRRWDRGFGTDAIFQVLAYAFQEMKLRRVSLGTDEDNLRGIRCYEKCGFVREGLLRAHRLREGKAVNAVVMGILREEWAGGRR